MCGRFASTTPPDQIAASDLDVEPDFNVAPTHDVPVVRVRDDSRQLDYLRWGLVPRWAKDLRIGSKLINARSETIATNNAFKSAFARRRCIVVADGFYEWQRRADKPMYITRRDGDPLALAGLYERWVDAENKREFHTCTILTCPPNDLMRPIHDRMPVLLAPSAWERWLDSANTDTEGLQSFLTAAPESLLEVRPVSDRVNSVKNNDPSLIEAMP